MRTSARSVRLAKVTAVANPSLATAPESFVRNGWFVPIEMERVIDASPRKKQLLLMARAALLLLERTAKVLKAPMPVAVNI
jgi:hypothetical protein